MDDTDRGKENQSENRKSGFQCDKCSRTFTLRSNLRRHERERHHVKKGEGDETEGFICHHCKKVFATIRRRASHVAREHNKEGQSESNLGVSSGHISCRHCDNPLKTIALLRQHLSDEHDIKDAPKKEEMCFKSVQEFDEWKQTIEKDTKSSYVALKGASKKLDGYSQTFYCNRSGYARLVPDDKRQRAPRAKGSRKVDNFCTSAIQISVKMSGETSVAFYKHHHGHGEGLADLVYKPLYIHNSLETAKQRLTELLSEVTAEAAACQSVEAVRSVTTCLLKLKAILNVGKQSQKQAFPSVPVSSSKSANKNVERQVRVFSKKRSKLTTPKDYGRPPKEARIVFC